MRPTLLALCVLTAAPAMAEDHDHHIAEADGLRVVHAWTPAAARGAELLIYMDIENRSGAETLLSGGEALGQRLELAGFTYGSAGEAWIRLPSLPIPAGAEVLLEPRVLALRLATLPTDLAQGEELDIEVHIDGHHITARAEIGAPNATAHSHAGHNH